MCCCLCVRKHKGSAHTGAHRGPLWGELNRKWGVGSLWRREAGFGLEDTEEELSTLRSCMKPYRLHVFSAVQFSRSVVSDSLRPHELQHARPPCPSPTLEFMQTHVHRVGDAIQPSHPLSSPFPPVPNPSLSSESTLHMRWPKYWSFSTFETLHV